MEKRKTFKRVKFDSKTFFALHKAIESLASSKINLLQLLVEGKGEEWKYNTIDEFLAAVDAGWGNYQVAAEKQISAAIFSQAYVGNVVVHIGAPSREEIEKMFSVLENDVERCRLPEPPPQPRPKPKVFIGHGRNPQWKDLKDHLHEKHGYALEAYEIGSRAGHAIRDILEEMLVESSFALLVMTGEDETKDGKLLARQNVVHESGLFQGRLGFSRAIILLEEGTEEFTNIAGLQQIRFAKDRIRETFGDVLSVLKRELG